MESIGAGQHDPPSDGKCSPASPPCPQGSADESSVHWTVAVPLRSNSFALAIHSASVIPFVHSLNGAHGPSTRLPIQHLPTGSSGMLQGLPSQVSLGVNVSSSPVQLDSITG